MLGLGWQWQGGGPQKTSCSLWPCGQRTASPSLFRHSFSPWGDPYWSLQGGLALWGNSLAQEGLWALTWRQQGFAKGLVCMYANLGPPGGFKCLEFGWEVQGPLEGMGRAWGRDTRRGRWLSEVVWCEASSPVGDWLLFWEVNSRRHWKTHISETTHPGRGHRTFNH